MRGHSLLCVMAVFSAVALSTCQSTAGRIAVVFVKLSWDYIEEESNLSVVPQRTAIQFIYLFIYLFVVMYLPYCNKEGTNFLLNYWVPAARYWILGQEQT